MPEPLTPEQRADLRRLHEAASETPWELTMLAGMDDRGEFDQVRADAALVAAAVNALPALLDTLDAQAAVIARLRAGWHAVATPDGREWFRVWGNTEEYDPMTDAEQQVLDGAAVRPSGEEAL